MFKALRGLVMRGITNVASLQAFKIVLVELAYQMLFGCGGGLH